MACEWVHDLPWLYQFGVISFWQACNTKALNNVLEIQGKTRDATPSFEVAKAGK